MYSATHRAATKGSGALLLLAAAACAAQPAHLAEMVCESCHTIQVAAKHDRAKDLVEGVCTLCHEFSRVERQELTKDEWAGLIKGMLAEGAPLTDDEFSMVVEYLANTYGVERKGCGAHLQTDQELLRAALRFARVPQKPAQGRFGPPDYQELGTVRPSRTPLCGRVPQKPAQGRFGPPNYQELGTVRPSQAPLCGRVSQEDPQ